MNRLLTATLSTLAFLGACDAGEAAPGPSRSASAQASGVATAEIVEPQVATVQAVKLANEMVEFDYSYPAAAAALSGLKAFLDEDLAKKRDALVADARQAKADSDANDYSWRPYALAYEWKVVTDLPRWLSLSTQVYNYTGGAHPNHGFDALLWDKTANVQRNAVDLFVSKEALAEALRQPFCAALDKERADLRGVPVNRDSGDQFDQCVDPTEQTVILGSAGGLAFDRIGILVSPYAAGPYVEGSYQVTVPVTPSVIAALKPQFRASFAVRR